MGVYASFSVTFGLFGAGAVTIAHLRSKGKQAFPEALLGKKQRPSISASAGQPNGVIVRVVLVAAVDDDPPPARHCLRWITSSLHCSGFLPLIHWLTHKAIM